MVKVIDVYAGIDDSRNTVRLGADAVAGKQPSAWPVAWRHRAWAVLREPKAMRSEITVDAVAKLFFYEKPGIEHCFAADRVLDPEQKFLGINKEDALVLVVEREQRRVVRRGNLEEEIDLRRDRNWSQEMIRAPQETGFRRLAASDGVHLVDEADRLGRLVDDPGVSRGFHLAKIGDVVVVRQVNHQRVDCQGSQFAAAFHASALLSKADIARRN